MATNYLVTIYTTMKPKLNPIHTLYGAVPVPNVSMHVPVHAVPVPHVPVHAGYTRCIGRTSVYLCPSSPQDLSIPHDFY